MTPQKERTELERKTYRVKEVAEALGLSATTINKLMSLGELKRIKLGASTLITAESVDALLERCAAEGG